MQKANQNEGSPGAAGGETVTQQGETQQPQPKMPHERDESSGNQARANASVRRIGEIAHDDVVEGQPDTEKGPVLDATYHELRKGEDHPKRK